MAKSKAHLHAIDSAASSETSPISSADQPHGTLSDVVFKQLQRAIVEGQLQAGEKISEPVLSREYGVSRSALREALTRLEACHLIERKPNVGARVVTLSREHLIEIYQIRESLEGLAAGLAAKNMRDEEIADLQELLQQHKSQIETDHTYFQKEGDMDFHFRIIKGSKNSRLIKLFSQDFYHLIRLYRYQFGMVSKRVPRAYTEHEYIVDAISQRDAEMAQFHMARHIRLSRENVEQSLQQEQDQ